MNGSLRALARRVGLFAALAIGASPLFAAERFGVGIIEPAAGRPVFGAVVVVIEIRGRAAERVELYLDGRRVGERTAPPWRFTVDVGQENRSRLLRVVATAVNGARDEAELELPTIRVDEVVDLQLMQLYVTATRDDAPALDLERGEFRVIDRGRPQALVTFERGDVPLTAVLLIDSSLSMRGERLVSALAGAREFIESMAPLDEAKVLVVSDQVIRRTPFGHDPEVLLGGIEGTLARGGTAIQDHLYLALRELEGRQGRRVVVLLSDGVDVDSLLGAADLDPIVGRIPALVYWIRLGGSGEGVSHRSIWRSVEEHSVELAGLARLVERSGGRIFDLPSPTDAAHVFREVIDELRNQYVLGYYPDSRKHDGRWREMEVEVSRREVELRTRQGYYDD